MHHRTPLAGSLNRRGFCQSVGVLAATTIFARGVVSGEEHASGEGQPGSPATPEEALRRLVEGNQRFVSGKVRHPHQSQAWCQSLETGQHPFAVVLGCADSRVCPELLFDQGFGDLFVVRVAGNIVDVDVTASIEYAVDHLNTKLVVVLGHSNCGAVTATLDHLTDAAGEPDEVVSLLYRIEPALAGLPQDLPREQQLARAVEMNVQHAVQRLHEVPDLRKSIKGGKLLVTGAVFDIHTGKVEIRPLK
jgi:carbonic anhydrase